MKMFLFPYIILVSSALQVFAQSQTDNVNDSRSFGWITFGAGFGGDKGLDCFGGCVSASYLTDSGLFSVRFSGAGRTGGEPAVRAGTRLEEFSELSGLYGISLHPSLFFVSMSSGLGVVWVKKRGLSGGTSTTMGIPVEIQAFITPLRVLGVGVNVFGNFNSKSSYGGVFFCLQFGKLR